MEEFIDGFIDAVPIVIVRSVAMESVRESEIAIAAVVGTASRPVENPEMRTNHAWRRFAE